MGFAHDGGDGRDGGATASAFNVAEGLGHVNT
jgi:hypothetical protein